MKVLDDLIDYAPRYMEEMESVFDQSQEQERKRISFLKNTLLSIHTHLDITNNHKYLRTLTLCVCVCLLLIEHI